MFFWGQRFEVLRSTTKECTQSKHIKPLIRNSFLCVCRFTHTFLEKKNHKKFSICLGIPRKLSTIVVHNAKTKPAKDVE